MKNNTLRLDLIISICLIAVVAINVFLIQEQNNILIEQIHQVRYMRSQFGEQYEAFQNESFMYGTTGRYFLGSGNIALYTKSQAPIPILQASSHEVGHYIYYELMFNKFVEDYEKIFVNSQEFVSDYAKTNAEEDFAETFSEALEFKINWDKIPKDRLPFFKKVLKGYFE